MNTFSVFPYNQNAQSIIDNTSLLVDGTLNQVISFKQDSNLLANISKETGIMTSANFESAVKGSHYDSIVFLDNIDSFTEQGYLKALRLATDCNKKIFLSNFLRKELKLSNYCNLNILERDIPCTPDFSINKLYEIDVPIICVAGFGENTDKFDIQLSLTSYYKNLGYNVATICSNPLGCLFGMYTIPAAMFEQKMSFKEKVILFNTLAYEINQSIVPDLIIVGIPGGIMPIDKHQFNYFAEMASIISYAIAVDIGILNLYFDQYIDDGYLEALQECCKYKYNIPIQTFCVARQKQDYDIERLKQNYYFLSNSFIDKYLPDYQGLKYPVINLAHPEEVDAEFSHLTNLLQNNVDSL